MVSNDDLPTWKAIMASTTPHRPSDSPADVAPKQRPSAQTRLPGALTYGVLAVWVSLVLGAIAAGGFENMPQLRWPLIVAVAAPVTVVTLAYRVSPRFHAYALALDARLVLAAQAWRVIGIAFLFALAFDRLPAAFAIPAGVGDLATGLAAVAALIAFTRGTLSTGRLAAFTTLGLGDFVVAIITGVATRPMELDQWPLIIFPTIMIPFFTILHLLTLAQHHDRRTTAIAGSTTP